MDDNFSIIGDWVPPPTPSPRTFFSAFMGGGGGDNDISSKSGTDGFLSGLQEQHLPAANAFGKDVDAQLNESAHDASSEHKFFNSRGGLVERMAARAGFNAPRLNTEGIRSADLSLSNKVQSQSQSPFLTIPPGLSPTTLLDSPVFLSNSLAQPSPTTGKFSFFPNLSGKSSGMDFEPPDRSKDNFFADITTASFSFRPVVEPASSGFHSTISKVNQATVTQQSFPSIEVSVQSENILPSHVSGPKKVQSQAENAFLFRAELSRPIPQKDDITDRRVYDSVSTGTEHSPPLDEQLDEIEQRACGDSMLAGGSTASEDGYNWRKYGQKQVKGSEYPRSYYKCTHPNCSVKKKVERSHEGHITEIIYKGTHNHPKPPPPRRLAVGALNPPIDAQSDGHEQAAMQTRADADKMWVSMQKGMAAGNNDWKHDNVEVASSTSNIGHEFGNQPSTMQAPHGAPIEPGDAVDASSTFSNDGDDDDRATHGSTGCEGEGDESESKRRKIENYAPDMGAGNRAIREPRVVVQTTSEVDILDDGYRWRKYGQKVVKGNPNPRSYYKCTSTGCTVRKHVERASHDLKSVITTYEGKHNHDVPAARNSSHVNSSGGGPGQAVVPMQTHGQRAEPSSNMTRFDRSPEFGAFTFPGRQQQQQLGGSMPPGFSFGPAGLTNLAMAGLGPGQAKMPIHPYLQQQQQRPMNETGFSFPKGEAKVEPLTESSLNNPTIYQHQAMMSRLPQM